MKTEGERRTHQPSLNIVKGCVYMVNGSRSPESTLLLFPEHFKRLLAKDMKACDPSCAYGKNGRQQDAR